MLGKRVLARLVGVDHRVVIEGAAHDPGLDAIVVRCRVRRMKRSLSVRVR